MMNILIKYPWVCFFLSILSIFLLTYSYWICPLCRWCIKRFFPKNRYLRRLFWQKGNQKSYVWQRREAKKMVKNLFKAQRLPWISMHATFAPGQKGKKRKSSSFLLREGIAHLLVGMYATLLRAGSTHAHRLPYDYEKWKTWGKKFGLNDIASLKQRAFLEEEKPSWEALFTHALELDMAWIFLWHVGLIKRDISHSLLLPQPHAVYALSLTDLPHMVHLLEKNDMETLLSAMHNPPAFEGLCLLDAYEHKQQLLLWCKEQDNSFNENYLEKLPALRLLLEPSIAASIAVKTQALQALYIGEREQTS